MSDLTVSQVRAARALLAWSQQDLAKAAQVAASTVADFERGHRTPMQNNADAMRRALEGAGVFFTGGGAVLEEPAAPLARSSSSPSAAAPLRWITASDLSEWADRRDGQAELPQLISRLAIAVFGRGLTVRFPSGDSVGYPGWDGLLETPRAEAVFPAGASAWEIGSQRERIREKADADYQKRSENPLGIDPATTTYVFATPRRWAGKLEWMKSRAAEGVWADVVAIDGDDLVHALDRYASVAHWLSERLGRRPAGLRSLSDVWAEWALATRRPLTSDLILEGRADQASAVMKWLREPASVLPVQAESREEALAFLHAAISELPLARADEELSRALAPAEADVARMVGDSLEGAILALADPDPGLARSLAEKGHHVFAALGADAAEGSAMVRLPRASRYDIARRLEDMGFARDEADRLAADSARSLGVLRRLIPNTPGRRPDWSIRPSPGLMTALLLGAWDDGREADRALASSIANLPYETLVHELSALAAAADGPLRRSDGIWKMASPRDAWLLLSSHLSNDLIERLLSAFHEVMSSADPRYDLPAEERWMAQVKGVVSAYSPMLRRGLTESLILLSLFGRGGAGAEDAPRVDAAVAGLLSGADERLWWSLSSDFQRLAEASPTAFLAALDDALDQSPSPLSPLFVADTGGWHETDRLPDLLWALERLAWSRPLFGRVVDVLARLAAIDPGGKSLNRPENTLRNLFLLWSPQSNTTLSERLAVLDRLRRQRPAEAWPLLVMLSPKGHDVMSPTAHPQWRDFSVEEPEEVTHSLMARGAGEIWRRLIEDAQAELDRWETLVELAPAMPPHERERMTSALWDVLPRWTDEAGREAVRTKLRTLLHTHREYPDADWSLPEAALSTFDALYEALAPSDPVLASAWLFDHRAALPRPSGKGYRASGEALDRLRRDAVADLLREAPDRILELARLTDLAGFIGKALADLEVAPALVDPLVDQSLASDEDRVANLAHGYVATMHNAHGMAWVEDLIARFHSVDPSSRAVLRILRALPERRPVWTLVERLGRDVETAYWKSSSVIWIDGDRDDIIFAAERFLDFGRARLALHLVGHHLDLDLPTSLLLRILDEAVRDAPPDGDEVARGNETTMFTHHVSEILDRVEGDETVPEDRLALLEWAYFPALRYTGRRMKTFHSTLARQPELFLQLLSLTYGPAKDSGVVEPPQPEGAAELAGRAYEVLEDWKRVPGSDDAGRIDPAALEAWVKRVRQSAAEVGRAVIADYRIGHILSAAKPGPDGIWPPEPVRDVIEITRSKDLEAGVRTGVFNRRGVTVRDPEAGGSHERNLAADYQRFAEALSLEWPRTAAMLDALKTTYLADAAREDDMAEQRQWL